MGIVKTAEFVSAKHPDKLCDVIADAVLDAFLAQDKKSRVAVEVMGGHKHISVSGEITSTANVDIPSVVRAALGPESAGYEVNVYLVKQSPQIAQGVDTGGAGDQGIMMGYATRETPTYMPLEYHLARELCKKIYAKFPFDGKTQITVEDGRVRTALASFQNASKEELLKLIREFIPADEYLANTTGDWDLGGFDADSGITGRKIVIDNYGPEIGVGGGAFSGKDYTKVDRSAAYMARYLAVAILRSNPHVEVVRTKLAYAIGKSKPVMAVAEVDGTQVEIPQGPDGYDLSPAGIKNFLKLDTVRYADTAAWGHFGREFPWG